MVVDMESKLIGKRIKLIRNIINEGGKLSVEQFAFVLQESGDKMRNYELGRAAVPNRVLQALHTRGFNITFIVAGEGDVFNNSPAGQRFKKVVQSRDVNLTELWEEIYKEIDENDIKKAEILKLEKENQRIAKEKEREDKQKAIAQSKAKAKEDKKKTKITKAAAGDMLKKKPAPKAGKNTEKVKTPKEY